MTGGGVAKPGAGLTAGVAAGLADAAPAVSLEAGVGDPALGDSLATEFWLGDGAEAMLQLRSAQLSQDDRWDHYWLCHQLLRQAA